MKIDVTHVAKLANLPISEAEKNTFETQLEETLDFVGILNEVNTQNVKPTNQVTGLENVTREDTIEPSLSQKEALKNTKSKHNGLFKVKAILDS